MQPIMPFSDMFTVATASQLRGQDAVKGHITVVGSFDAQSNIGLENSYPRSSSRTNDHQGFNGPSLNTSVIEIRTHVDQVSPEDDQQDVRHRSSYSSKLHRTRESFRDGDSFDCSSSCPSRPVQALDAVSRPRRAHVPRRRRLVRFGPVRASSPRASIGSIARPLNPYGLLRVVHTPGSLLAGPGGYTYTPVSTRSIGYESLLSDHGIRFKKRTSFIPFIKLPSLLCDEDALPSRVKDRIHAYAAQASKRKTLSSEGNDKNKRKKWSIVKKAKKLKKLFG